MKQIVHGVLNELSRDLHELGRLRFEDNDDDQHTFNALALRVETIQELVDKYFELTDESAKNAVRWKFLFRTPGISFDLKDQVFNIYKDVVDTDQHIVSRKLISSGDSLPAAVNRFLGL